jgi:oxygen-independent coproporphyrinogen-3 oxidase
LPEPAQLSAVSAYLHIPFCQTRCAYCDFNTYADLEDLIPAYVSSLEAEIRGVARASTTLANPVPTRSSEPIALHSVFIGGGTPSKLSVDQVDSLLRSLHDAYHLTPNPEITLEANPGRLGLGYLEGVRQAGVNRLSLGVQSAHPSELQLLERTHSFVDVIHAVRDARRAGFTNVNLDLIFGLPHQSMAAWRESLSLTLELEPDHLSLYALSLEFGTPMHAWVGRGLIPEPDPDLAADMYAWATDKLEASGFVHYEISNWARGGPAMDEVGGYAACRHNLQYWRNRAYLGFGAGAHGCAAGWRYANVRSPRAYIRRLTQGVGFDFPFSPAVVERRLVPPTIAMNETMMLGLRLVDEGVSETGFRMQYGVSVDEAFGRPMERLEEDGLIQRQGGRLKLTRRAYFIANQVFCMFV